MASCLVMGSPRQVAQPPLQRARALVERARNAVLVDLARGHRLEQQRADARRHGVGREPVEVAGRDAVGLRRELGARLPPRVLRRSLARGDRVHLGPVMIAVLHPPPGGESAPSPPGNEDSLVLRLTYGRVSVLLTGDAGEATERALLGSGADLRSDVLKAGLFGGLGLTLAGYLRLAEAGQVSPEARSKSGIFIILAGGPSHLDSFDLKPDAPAEFRGEFHPIKTNVPGVEFCEHLPKLAQCADKFAVLRGRPYEELVAYAMAHEMDMIVLGIRGYGLVKSLLMGSTTDRVVRNAPSPVLAVSSQAQKP